MAPRRKRPFQRVPYRKHGYRVEEAAELLTSRGLPTTQRMLRFAADRGDVPCLRSPGGHRRFLAADLERLLWRKLDTRAERGLE